MFSRADSVCTWDKQTGLYFFDLRCFAIKQPRQIYVIETYFKTQERKNPNFPAIIALSFCFCYWVGNSWFGTGQHSWLLAFRLSNQLWFHLDHFGFVCNIVALGMAMTCLAFLCIWLRACSIILWSYFGLLQTPALPPVVKCDHSGYPLPPWWSTEIWMNIYGKVIRI